MTLHSARLTDFQWLSLACRIKTNLSMAFKAFLDLPQPVLESQTYVYPSASQARHLRIATSSSGFTKAFPVLEFGWAIPSVQGTLPHLFI